MWAAVVVVVVLVVLVAEEEEVAVAGGTEDRIKLSFVVSDEMPLGRRDSLALRFVTTFVTSVIEARRGDCCKWCIYICIDAGMRKGNIRRDSDRSVTMPAIDRLGLGARI